MQRERTVVLVAFAALALVLSGATMLATEGDTAPKVEGPKVEASAVVPGTDLVIHQGASASEEAKAILNDLAMMAFVDAETGALRAPTQAEVQKLAAAGKQLQSIHARSQMDVREFPVEGGGVAAELPQELHAMALVRLEDDGELTYGCSDAEAAHGKAVAASTTREEEE